MKLKKHLRTLFSFLLLAVFLLTGCSPETEELATDVVNAIIESDYEAETENIELPVLENEDSSQKDSDVLLEEEVTDDITEDEKDTDAALEDEEDIVTLAEDGTYTSKDEVAAYLHEYGHLPSNFITKKDAKKLGWVSSEGNLDEVAPGMSIGGDYFGNYEGTLPEADGRDYHECDIDFNGTYRNGKRIVYSNDGLIYYTEDHYETFELLYGEE